MNTDGRKEPIELARVRVAFGAFGAGRNFELFQFLAQIASQSKLRLATSSANKWLSP